MKTLVATSCWGEGRLDELNKVLSGYQEMPGSVDVVVCSDRDFRRDLIPDTEKMHISMFIGSAGTFKEQTDTWDLCWVHRDIFASKVEDYDLFIASQSDILITQRSVGRFLWESANLPPEYITGFIAYEIAADTGEKLFVSMDIKYPAVKDMGVGD